MKAATTFPFTTSWTQGPLKVKDESFSPEEIIQLLSSKVTDDRLERIKQIALLRSGRLITVTESLHDRGNLSAVMRSAEAFGFHDFRIIENPLEKFKAANRASMGTDKWLKIVKYQEAESAISDLKAQGFRILTTDLDSRVSIQDVDFGIPSAVVFGNEKMGISREMKRASDLNFKIPLLGFAQSFNISVAAALTYQVARQRIDLENSGQDFNRSIIELTANYLLRSVDRSHDILLHSRSTTSPKSPRPFEPLSPQALS